MMGVRPPAQDQLFAYGVNLEKRVPPEHLLRKIAGVLDLSFARAAVAASYGERGHVSEDPVVILKLMLLLFLDDVKSERELMKIVPLRLDYLWFLGLGLEDEAPHHSVLSKARARWGEGLFEQLFIQTVHQCVDAGLVQGSKLHADSSLVDADASRDSVIKGAPELIGRLKAAYAAQAAKLEENQRGGQGASVNERLMSTTDADATMARKGPGDSSRPRYHHHRALDEACGVVVAVETTTGSVNEASRLSALVAQAQDHTGSQVDTVVADRKYGTNHNFVALAEMGIKTHMADLSEGLINRRSEGIYGDEHFVFNAQANTYTCPAGQVLKPRAFHALKRTWEYAAKREVCAACALRSQCTRSRHERTLRRHEKQELLSQARAQSRSRGARRDRRRRMHLMEQSFADAANHHGFKRSRWRRLWRQRIQDWLIAAAQNLRILVRARPPTPGASAAQSLKSTLKLLLQVLKILIRVRLPAPE
jgi:transposase/RNase P protein component